MITYLSLSLLLSIFIFTNHIQLIYGQAINRQVHGRVFPGCALITNTIYCFGGFIGTATNVGSNYNNPVNDHYSLDLSAFGNFSVIDRTNIQWVSKSNTVNGNPFGAVGQIASTTVSDGSYVIYGGRYANGNTQPFAVYHPDSDQWNGLSLPNNNYYYVFSQIVNTGNDHIWIWGGALAGSPSESLTGSTYYSYDYKSGIWPTAQPSAVSSLAYHTATLVNNTIYLIGGTAFTNSSARTLVTFNNFRTFSTIDSTWGNITAVGTTANDRSYHTTVATDDGKYLIIYGGCQFLKGGFRALDDTYYVYNIEKNYLLNITMVNPPAANTHHRFGHFATLYNSTFLVLVFGYTDASTPTADNFNVLNIQNVTNPQWVSFIGANNNGSSDGSSGVNLKTVIPAVVVPIVVVLSAAAIAAFLIIRRRKRKQEKQFILEQEDPRKLMDGDNDIPLYSEGITPETRLSSNNYSDEQYNNKSETNDHHETIKPSEFVGTVKPSEVKETAKPFESHR